MFFSVITINLNNRKGLERTVQSVISQRFHNFEYIVIDGGSNDGSQEVIKKYSDKIDYWISEKDDGIYQAMNKGIKASSGNFLIFLNSGDFFVATTVLADASKLIYPDDEIVAGMMRMANSLQNPVFNPPKEITIDYLLRYSLPHQAMFFNRSVFEEHGFYNEELKIVADWAHYLEMLIVKNLKYKYLPIFISEYEGNGVSSDKHFFDLHTHERDFILKKLFSERIYRSFSSFSQIHAISTSRNFIFVENIHRSPFFRRITSALLHVISIIVDSFLGKRSQAEKN